MASEVKSLKKFTKESSIKKEVAKWDIDDCIGYLLKHKKDNKIRINITLKNLEIVAAYLIIKVGKWNLKDFGKYTSKCSSKGFSEYLIEEYEGK